MLYNIVAYTNIGRRLHQEDNYSIGENFIMVADGVGGQAKGFEASEIVCNHIKFRLDNNPPDLNTIDFWVDQTINEILAQLYAKAEDDQDFMGMGSTLAMVYSNAKDVYAIHLGDSRIYHFSQLGGLKWRSKDHSLVQELIDSGILTEAQAKSHPKKNVITRALQAKEDYSTRASVYKLRVEEGDRILVCTDGITESWDDESLSKLFESFLDNKGILKEIELFASSNSNDNNTAIVASLGHENLKM